MINAAIGAAAGLVVGWFFFPRPQWAKDLYDKIAVWLRARNDKLP